VDVPALVMNGGTTDPPEGARALATILPTALHRELAGQTHNVKPEVLAPAVVEFFTGVVLSGRS
jgi:hypothetical protein